MPRKSPVDPIWDEIEIATARRRPVRTETEAVRHMAWRLLRLPQILPDPRDGWIL